MEAKATRNFEEEPGGQDDGRLILVDKGKEAEALERKSHPTMDDSGTKHSRHAGTP